MIPQITKKDRHSKYLNLLAKVAATVPPVAQARFAAAIVYQNNIVSFGINSRKSCPFQKRFGKNEDSIYLHSETSAIKNALRLITLDDLTKSTLYICRVKYVDESKKRFIFGLSKPCFGCSKAITEFGIKRVIYTTEGFDYASY